MIRYGYGTRALAADYLRAAAGAGLCGAAVLFGAAASVMLWLLGGLAALFVAYGVRTALRQATCIEVTADGIRTVGPFGAAIAWKDIQRLDVRYFSTRKDRSNGWMELVLSGAGRRIRADSTIDDFADLARRAAAAASAAGVPLNEATRVNLAALAADRPAGTAP